MKETEAELQKTEFDALRREIEIHISERRKIESQLVIGISALYAWSFSIEPTIDPILFRLALLIPPIVIFLSFLRWASLHLRTMKIGQYIRKLESEQLQSCIGWESFIAEDRANRPFWGQLEGWSEFLVWLALFVGSLIALNTLPNLM
ncbi:MAG: hypothetical protein JNK19_10705 [Tabrizicola sp.]|nr:hypothetical protein [Tabrizicola sp.]